MTPTALHKPAPTDLPLHPLIRDRWSPRAFAPTPVEPEKLALLIEAARWAPSSSNEQPWFLLIGDRASDREGHARILQTLVPANAAWAARAPVLAIAGARLNFARNGRPNHHALYDTGQAVAQLALEATSLGLAVHQMAGFDAEKARDLLGIPEGDTAVAAMAIGYPESPDTLNEELRRREFAPRSRRPAAEWAFRAHWGAAL